MSLSTPKPPSTHWRLRLHEIIFEADTPAGKAFDIILIGSILVSVVIVMLDSIGRGRRTRHRCGFLQILRNALVTVLLYRLPMRLKLIGRLML